MFSAPTGTNSRGMIGDMVALTGVLRSSPQVAFGVGANADM